MPVIVCDTNVLLAELDGLEVLRQAHNAVFVLPMAVLGELDRLKTAPDTSTAARRASHLLSEWQQQAAADPRARLLVQAPGQSVFYPHSHLGRADGAILGCALHAQRLVPQAAAEGGCGGPVSVVLLTGDLNLSIAARASGLAAMSPAQARELLVPVGSCQFLMSADAPVPAPAGPGAPIPGLSLSASEQALHDDQQLVQAHLARQHLAIDLWLEHAFCRQFRLAAPPARRPTVVRGHHARRFTPYARQPRVMLAS